MIRTITSLQHPIVKHLVKLRQDRNYRYETGSVIVEGNKLIQEIGPKHAIKTLLALNSDLIPPQLQAAEVFLVNESILEKISGMHSSEGLIAEIAMPQNASLKGKNLILAFDGVSDPGNLGTLLRSGLALGWQGAFILKNCCDPFNDKAIRAAKGATFSLPIATGTWKDLEKIQKENQLTPFVADIQGTPLNKILKTTNVLLILSNEAHGPSKQALSFCQPVTIPMSPQMESLNVSAAGAILMYTLGKIE
jgi:TrmH family RNA methyltransferase